MLVVRRWKWLLLAATVCLLLSSCGFLDYVTGGSRRPPNRYLIPQGYTGWVQVEYGIRGAPPLPNENDYHVLRFGPDGKLQTSTPFIQGFAADEYFYEFQSGRSPLPFTAWCKGGKVWGSISGTENGVHYEKVFIGSEQLYRKEVDPTGAKLYPCRKSIFD